MKRKTFKDIKGEIKNKKNKIKGKIPHVKRKKTNSTQAMQYYQC